MFVVVTSFYQSFLSMSIFLLVFQFAKNIIPYQFRHLLYFYHLLFHNTYSHHWNACKAQITAALSEAFSIDCTGLFNDLRCNLSLNPIEPRFLKEHCYDTFYLNSANGAIGGGIHEIIHFIWFYVWNQLFGDSYDEYERPSLKWILSEMVVESVMRDERLSSINPYFPRENGGCVYPYFFDMMVDGKPILDTLDAMYRSQNIEDFMRSSYAYCQEHEAVIREHILKSEG